MFLVVLDLQAALLIFCALIVSRGGGGCDGYGGGGGGGGGGFGGTVMSGCGRFSVVVAVLVGYSLVLFGGYCWRC